MTDVYIRSDIGTHRENQHTGISAPPIPI